jgi:3-methyl-2-oxobutanoate hydroxymethyltransferase
VEPNQKITPEWIALAKTRGERVPALTAYDYPTARLLDEAGVPVILVGDSVGMVVLGYPDTTEVTLAEIRHHVGAVARAKTRALVVADLSYHTYDTPEEAVASARVLIEAGAEAVKLEGGIEVVAEIRALREAGIAVMAHIGMLPQHVKEEGGYKIKPLRGGEGTVVERREGGGGGRGVCHRGGTGRKGIRPRNHQKVRRPHHRHWVGHRLRRADFGDA